MNDLNDFGLGCIRPLLTGFKRLKTMLCITQVDRARHTEAMVT